MTKIEQIIEGWKNHLFPSPSEEEKINIISDERMLICRECEHNSIFHKSIRPDEHCMICACTLIPKTKCLSCSCPKGNWKEVQL